MSGLVNVFAASEERAKLSAVMVSKQRWPGKLVYNLPKNGDAFFHGQMPDVSCCEYLIRCQ